MTEPRQDEPDAAESAADNEQSGDVIRLVNQILVDAFQRGASDIHVEPSGSLEPVVVRLRVDGDCVEYQKLAAALGPPVIARIKIMADLDISERRKPQDGKIRFRMSGTSA
jgi:type II secretory ATPase GspE/PulE/Tfp pilus assembly ATPase PilB-like protein